VDKIQFEGILKQACEALTVEARAKIFPKPLDFENRVREVLEQYLKPYGLTINYDFELQAFPDIAIGEYGVEVKHALADTWRSVANSIQEGKRYQDVRYVYIVFGKMGGIPEVKYSKYEDSVIHVRTSHLPRFEIEINGREPIFRKFDVTYDEFRNYDIHKKMEFVRKYARSRLKKGERMWWLEDQNNEQHSLPIKARLFTKIEKSEKRKLRAQAIILCPQILKGSTQRDKYDDAALFILTYHGVICHQARDLFSAGSVSPEKFRSICGRNNHCRSLMDIQDEIIAEIQELDSALFEEYWGCTFPRNKLLEEWLQRADKNAKNWKPSTMLTKIVSKIEELSKMTD
jgi:hypothetical protein